MFPRSPFPGFFPVSQEGYCKGRGSLRAPFPCQMRPCWGSFSYRAGLRLLWKHYMYLQHFMPLSDQHKKESCSLIFPTSPCRFSEESLDCWACWILIFKPVLIILYLFLGVDEILFKKLVSFF